MFYQSTIARIALFIIFTTNLLSLAYSKEHHPFIQAVNEYQARLDSFIISYSKNPSTINFDEYDHSFLNNAAKQIYIRFSTPEKLALAKKIYLYIRRYNLENPYNKETTFARSRHTLILGKILLKEKDIESAKSLFTKEEKTMHNVMAFLGDCEASEKNWEQAFYWYKRSYEKQQWANYFTGLKLAACYELGRGTEKNEALAAEIRIASLQSANRTYGRWLTQFRRQRQNCESQSPELSPEFSASIIISIGNNISEEVEKLQVPYAFYLQSLYERYGLMRPSNTDLADELEEKSRRNQLYMYAESIEKETPLLREKTPAVRIPY